MAFLLSSISVSVCIRWFVFMHISWDVSSCPCLSDRRLEISKITVAFFLSYFFFFFGWCISNASLQILKDYYHQVGNVHVYVWDVCISMCWRGSGGHGADTGVTLTNSLQGKGRDQRSCDWLVVRYRDVFSEIKVFSWLKGKIKYLIISVLEFYFCFIFPLVKMGFA